MNKHLKYKTVDAYGKEVTLSIRNFDKDFIKLEINGEDSTLHYDKFAEFIFKANSYLKDKRFK